MSETINWLHLTDLHFGLDEHNWLWPQIKHEFFRDIEFLTREIGGWDIVFFTGDLTNRGTKAEFDKLSEEFKNLWAIFTKLSSSPKLCVIPGNHDLVRPASDSAIAATMTQLWWQKPELRKRFWTDPNCEYRTAVTKSLANYSEWVANSPIPMLSVKHGLLPGDFSATIEKEHFKLGIVGLNSTFLQIAGGDFRGKLELHVSQLNEVCNGDATDWLKNHSANVLLTHQPPSWLAPESLQHYRQEIYPAGRFISQLCGHQHEPEAFEISEAGAAPRRLRQSPSLFGLEKWEGVTPQQRIHGYTAGQFIFEQSGGIEKLWPRIAIPGLHGGLNIAPDYRYKLEHNCVVSSFEINEAPSIESNPTAPDIQGTAECVDAIEVPKQSIPIQLLENPVDEQTARKLLAACPHLPLTAGPQHRHIRLEEQSQFELELRKNRCIWLVADWGTGKDGFLTSGIERLRATDSLPDIFHLKCDDASDIDAFEALFPQQAGMQLQTFCGYLTPLKGVFLVLDGIHPGLCSGIAATELKRITSAILDYCPEIRLVLSSRIFPEKNLFQVLELTPLDVPDVRTYLLHHPDATPELREADVVEKLHEQSDGLPMHLDKMLKALKVSSLPSVLEAEMEGPSVTSGLPEDTPKALIHAVSLLEKSQDRSTKRSLRLLKVLSVLPYGETLEALRHFLPAEPFFPENALQLNELALLDVIPLQLTSPSMRLAGRDDKNAPKLLKVPRQVRDYVLTQLSDSERKEIVDAGAERFFGREWREGKIKLRIPPAEYREYLGSGAGNEFALVHNLILQAKQACDQFLISKAATLGLQYCRHLKSKDRFRDLAVVAGSLVQILDRDEHTSEWVEFASLYGEGLRMTNKLSEALTYLRESLAIGEPHFDTKRKASIWLEIALAESCLEHTELAVEAAEKAKNYTEPDSATALQAVSIITETKFEEPQRATKLREIERKARKMGYETIADNIALDFALDCEKASEKVPHLDRVLKSDVHSYNFYRAIVAKASALKHLEEPKELNPQEVVALADAYSYFHAQRFNTLFDLCHENLWRLFSNDQTPVRLLRLFRHSSFVWRVRGEEVKEKDYLDRLSKLNVKTIDTTNQKSLILELGYYIRRLKVVLIEVVSLKPIN